MMVSNFIHGLWVVWEYALYVVCGLWVVWEHALAVLAVA